MKIIYAIPGLGTTKELYSKIAVQGYEIKTLDWPLPERDIQLKEYARKFLPQINTGGPVNLLGVSFGGMLCTEIAETISVNKVFLVSSSGNRTEFPAALKALKTLPVYRLVPDKVIRKLAKTKRKFIGFEKSFEPAFVDMVDRMAKDYFSICVDYIINWDRETNTRPVIRIHGTADRLLPNLPAGKFYRIKGGSHAMILNNAGEINDILNNELNGL